MNGVIGMTELALDTQLTLEQREYLETARSSADSMMAVINDILDFSKIEAMKLQLESIDFEIRDCIGDAAKTLAAGAHQKGLEVVCDVSPTVPLWVSGDPIRLRQILLNLIGNAIKFTAQGEVIVRAAAHPLGDSQVQVHFQVIDTGIGIPEDKQKEIFEAFAQADGSSTRKYGGTGLGLTISTRLVEMMGGKLWVESKPNQGSNFQFTVRLGPAVEDAHSTSPSLQVSELRNLSVLVVDDNRTNRFIFSRILENWGMKPTLANSGEEALRLLDSPPVRPFALILLDYNMPRMDGIMVAQRIKNRPEFRATTILMLSSGGEPGEAWQARHAGVAICLFKPFKQSELLGAILKALGKVAPAESVTGARPRPAQPEGQQPLRILLAEDNRVNQVLAVRLLEKRGHSVISVQDGCEAVNALASDNFDVALLDVQMPVMDGLQAAGLIRKQERESGRRHLPLIALTAHAMTGDRELCLAAGMDGYVAKPINPDELFAAIRTVLGTPAWTPEPGPLVRPAQIASGLPSVQSSPGASLEG